MENFFSNYEMAISNLATIIKSNEINNLLKALTNSRQILIFGSGLSLILGNKFNHHLRSLGLVSFATSIGDLEHGELGVITKDTCIVYLSRSGNLIEVSSVLEFADQVECKINIITEATFDGNLKYNCISLGKSTESDPFGLIPTVSFAKMSIFLDYIIYCLVKDDSNFPNEFLKRHPSGSLGRLLSAPIEVYIRDFLSPIKVADDTLKVKFEEVENQIGVHERSLLPFVNENGKLLAVVSDGDLRRSRHKFESHMLVSLREIMSIGTFSPRTIKIGSTVAQAKKLFLHPPEISCLVVIDENDMYLGLVHARDLLVLESK